MVPAHADRTRPVNRDHNAAVAGATTIPLGGRDPDGKLNNPIDDRTDWYQVKGHADKQGLLTYSVEQRSGAPLTIEFYECQSGQIGAPRLLTPTALTLDQPGQKVL